MVSIVSSSNGVVRLMRISVGVWMLFLAFVCTSWLWPIYLLCRLQPRWERPPTIPHLSQVLRYLAYTWTPSSFQPPLTLLERVYLTLQILKRVAFLPVWAVCWYLDELLYGSELDRQTVESPLFLMSGMRSGSTQTGLYLSSDPTLLSPMIIQCMFPYLWLWRWFPSATIDRYVVSISKLHSSLIHNIFPKEFLERHEGDMCFQPDTFEIAFYSFHLNVLSDVYGPEIAAVEIGTGSYAPHNRSMWEEDFVHLVDRIARKTLLFYPKDDPCDPKQQHPQFWLKGHFLCAGDALERRFPDAHFLTLTREPAPRIRSAVNFAGSMPRDPFLGSKCWKQVAQAIETTETIYCEREQDWFQNKRTSQTMMADGSPNKETMQCRHHVIRFQDFCKNDVTTTMEYIYRHCLGRDHVPSCIPRNHPERNRDYTVNKTLQELDINEEKLKERLKSYIAWCRGADEVPPKELVEKETTKGSSMGNHQNSIHHQISSVSKSSSSSSASKKLQ